MWIVDKVIESINPIKAVERYHARETLELARGIKNYSNGGASHKDVFIDLDSSGNSPDDDITRNHKILRARSRQLFMNTEIGAGALKTMRTTVIGQGLKAKPQIDNEVLGINFEEARKLEQEIMREWKLFSESTDIDFERKHDFDTLQMLAYLSMVMNGDVFYINPYKKRVGRLYETTVQLIEADRVTNSIDSYSNKIIEGIEVDDSGEVIAYHISNIHPGTYGIEGSVKRIPAYSQTGKQLVHHLFIPERVGQKRGVPTLATVVEAVYQISQYQKAEIKRAVILGVLTAFITTQKPNVNGIFAGAGVKPEERKTKGKNKLEMRSGNFNMLEPGEDVKVVSGSQAQSQFENFFNAVATQIGIAIEMPKDVLLKSFNSSYSASRASLMEWWRTASAAQAFMAKRFCQPTYENFLIEAQAKGRLILPGFFDDPIKMKAYSRCKWVGEKKGHLDPVKEVVAAQKRVEAGFSSIEIEAQEMGNDWEEVNKQRAIENKMREKEGLIEQKQEVLGNKKSNE